MKGRGKRPQPKRMRKIIIKEKQVEQVQPKSDYLKYLKVARYWVKRKYGLSLSDLEMLLFLRTQYMFKREDFNKYDNIFSFDRNRFDRLQNEGWVVKFREAKYGEIALYEVSSKCKRMLNNFYKKLEGESPYSESKNHNPIFNKSKQNFVDKTMAQAMRDINEENRLQMLIPSHFDYSKEDKTRRTYD